MADIIWSNFTKHLFPGIFCRWSEAVHAVRVGSARSNFRGVVEPCELLAQSLDLVPVRLVELLRRIGVELLDEVLLVLDVDLLEVLGERLLFPVELLLVLPVLSVELPVELLVSDDGLGRSNSEFSDWNGVGIRVDTRIRYL